MADPVLAWAVTNDPHKLIEVPPKDRPKKAPIVERKPRGNA